jgi:serine protease Do
LSIASVEKQIIETVAELEKSVVSIGSVRIHRDFRFGPVPLEGQGSGVIIDKRGYILTNNHVIDNSARVRVTLKDGRTFVGEVTGTDPSTDLALIGVEAGADLSAAQFGDSEALKVGQIVLAVGNALGLPGAPTVSMGVISALGRPLPGTDFVPEGLIQTDASINPGNSGGPLSDLNGNVIGINTAMIPYAQGVGFAIPADTVKRVVEQILQKGRVVRPWLGISGVDMNSAIAKRYDLTSDKGVLLAETARDGPAYEAGLRAGDIIVKIGETEIKRMRDLVLALSKVPIADCWRHPTKWPGNPLIP